MAKLICRVCGAEYDACRTARLAARQAAGSYRWQEVACCLEHGSIYLERIIASRQPNAKTPAENLSESEVLSEGISETRKDENGNAVD